MTKTNKKVILTNGSLLIIEALAKAGSDAFIGYPITPANHLYYYAMQRFPFALPAQDEITTLQWMSGFSVAGKLPVTATSFPGLALMVESINMAYMMELPMVIVLVQRLGPSTGTATCGAQGDLLTLRGLISGGYPVPTLTISDFDDCWNLSKQAASMAIKLRTPVILLTSKEMVMTSRSFDINNLSEINPIKRNHYNKEETYQPYKPLENGVPSFLPVGHSKHQVRFNASTHNELGLLQHSTKEAMANTSRLQSKIKNNLSDFAYYELDEMKNADKIILSFGISSIAAREAIIKLREKGIKISMLIVKTLLPILPKYYEILEKYKHIIIAEENLDGQYSKILYGEKMPENIININSIGKMINARQIVEEVNKI